MDWIVGAAAAATFVLYGAYLCLEHAFWAKSSVAEALSHLAMHDSIRLWHSVDELREEFGTAPSDC